MPEYKNFSLRAAVALWLNSSPLYRKVRRRFNAELARQPTHLAVSSSLRSIPDCFRSFCGRYQVFRKDRINSQGGGVMALVDTNLSACNVVLPDKYSSLELLCFVVFMSSLTVRFIVCYRPPNYDSDASNYLSLLLPCIEQLAAHKNPHNINW